jgi:hypothetical protein
MINEKAIREAFHDLKFIVPPMCQGQMVEYAYACDADLIYVKIFDRSDRTLKYSIHEHPENAKEGDWEPWNRTPAVGDHVITLPDWED